jgi:hypothetical protein
LRFLGEDKNQEAIPFRLEEGQGKRLSSLLRAYQYYNSFLAVDTLLQVKRGKFWILAKWRWKDNDHSNALRPITPSDGKISWVSISEETVEVKRRIGGDLNLKPL